MREREIVVREPSTPQRIASAAWSLATSVARGGRAANVVSGAHALMSSVLERLQPCARPTTENGSQCVGSSECSRLTELMPSSAASPSIMVAWPAPTAMSLYVRSLLSASGRPLRDVSVAHASPGSGLVKEVHARTVDGVEECRHGCVAADTTVATRAWAPSWGSARTPRPRRSRRSLPAARRKAEALRNQQHRVVGVPPHR